MLIARSPRAGTARCTGSETTYAPGAIVIDLFPSNVSSRSELATIVSPVSRIARCAAPMTGGWVPKLFVSLTRAGEPPRLVRTTCRRLWSLKASPAVVRDSGAVLQVPTQC